MTTDKSSMPLRPACHASGGRECEFLEGEGVLPLYRNESERMLRRYFYLSLDLGRLPSMLGGEAFRARASSTRPHTFEDLVIFVHDIERRLEELAPELLETIAAVVFLDQSHEEAAASLGLSRRQVERRYIAALDELSRRLLVTGLMRASHSSLQEPDCDVCLRNPAFTVGNEWSAEAAPCPDASTADAAWTPEFNPSPSATDVLEFPLSPQQAQLRRLPGTPGRKEEVKLPPKKPAASVRRVELGGKRDEPRRAVIARMNSYVLGKTSQS
ncbi:MAG: hypothetical protein ABSD88_03505 [Candidatus Korobacteraceae bacterium]|jgi:hypothetical protein